MLGIVPCPLISLEVVVEVGMEVEEEVVEEEVELTWPQQHQEDYKVLYYLVV